MTGTLSPEQVFEALGIEFIVFENEPDAFEPIGMSPVWTTAAGKLDGKALVWIDPRWNRNFTSAIHEALHLMMGTKSLLDEGPLMPVEWLVCQELAPNWYDLWRSDFADYSMSDNDGNYTEVGHTEKFLELNDWSNLLMEAFSLGFLTSKYQPIWGMGLHPSFQ